MEGLLLLKSNLSDSICGFGNFAMEGELKVILLYFSCHKVLVY